MLQYRPGCNARPRFTANTRCTATLVQSRTSRPCAADRLATLPCPSGSDRLCGRLRACEPEREPPGEPADTVDIVISDWSSKAFWRNVMWYSAVPGTLAVICQLELQGRLFQLQLPHLHDAHILALLMLPVLLLDATTLLLPDGYKNIKQDSIHLRGHDVAPAPSDASAGWSGPAVRKQRRRRKTSGALQESWSTVVVAAELLQRSQMRQMTMRQASMPVVQRNVADMFKSVTQQLIWQCAITESLVEFVRQQQLSELATVMVVPGLPYLADVDPDITSMVALVSVLVTLTHNRLSRAVDCLDSDFLDKYTGRYLATMGSSQPFASTEARGVALSSTGTGSQERWAKRLEKRVRQYEQSYAIKEGLFSLRLGLHWGVCALVYLGTGSVVASAWTAFALAKFHDAMLKRRLEATQKRWAILGETLDLTLLTSDKSAQR